MFIEYFRMDLSAEIKQLAESKLSDSSHFIVDVLVSAKRGPKKVMVLMDGDNGISIDDCANMSRALSETLDAMPQLEESYTLEVSTPGVDHPLKLNRQYPKNIGRNLRVTWGGQLVEGKLEQVSDLAISLIVVTGKGKKKEEKTVVIPFSEIEKAFVLVSFK